MRESAETTRALDDIVKKGWVRYVGYCNYPAWITQKMLDIQEKNGQAKFMSGQMYYSLLGRDIEQEVLPFLEANGLGLMVWSPLASGFLTGKYTRNKPAPKDSRRAKFDFPPIDIEQGYDVVAKLKEIGSKDGASIPQVALAWLLAKPYVSSIIIGATKIHQLEDNLSAADLRLAEEDIQVLNELTATPAPYPLWMQDMGWDQKVRQALEVTKK
jgi:aryl-alcohol dehydrogenase-like predicted oxidoreductase